MYWRAFPRALLSQKEVHIQKFTSATFLYITYTKYLYINFSPCIEVRDKKCAGGQHYLFLYQFMYHIPQMGKRRKNGNIVVTERRGQFYIVGRLHLIWFYIIPQNLKQLSKHIHILKWRWSIVGRGSDLESIESMSWDIIYMYETHTTLQLLDPALVRGITRYTLLNSVSVIEQTRYMKLHKSFSLKSK